MRKRKSSLTSAEGCRGCRKKCSNPGRVVREVKKGTASTTPKISCKYGCNSTLQSFR